MTAIPRTREAIEKFSIPEPNSGCWLWLRSVNPQGYGRLGRGRAHRVSYEVFHGPVPAAHDVCHRCDQPGCVNPDHLFAGTRQDNVRDCVRKGRTSAQRKPVSPKAKLSPEQVTFIRAQYRRADAEFGGRALAVRFGVSPSVISTVVRGKTWSPERLARAAAAALAEKVRAKKAALRLARASD